MQAQTALIIVSHVNTLKRAPTTEEALSDRVDKMIHPEHVGQPEDLCPCPLQYLNNISMNRLATVTELRFPISPEA